jgi:hypothetical protein
MQIGKYIHAKLTAAAPVTAIVGTGANARIYPVFLPMNTTGTSVVYMVEPEPHGASKSDEGTHLRSNVTLHLWADVSQGQLAYSTLEDLDVAIYDALNYVDATAGGVTVESCRHLKTTDWRDEQNMYFLKTAVYTIVHRR